MTNEEFDRLLEARIDKIRATLKSKASEYANSTDRLYNFKAAADLASKSTDISPEGALWGMALKHIISVQDMVFLGYKMPHDFIDEKIGDMINYSILLEAILKEK